MYIKKISLRNIRCFKKFEMEFDIDGEISPFALILGNNATGKTTLIKSIALGMCDESSAASLMKEADAGYIRDGMKRGYITIELQRNKRGKTYRIQTTLIKEHNWERLSQKIDDRENFPWEELFVCGYGAGRGTSGAGDITGYSVLNAVYNLFNYTEGLQNPELSLLRIKNESARKIFLRTLNILLKTDNISLGKKGIFIKGSWGKLPLRDLADGYKSTFLWVADFLGWAFSINNNLKNTNSINGIILIDEIEQHLHPQWQQQIVKLLKEQFPKVQFIATTHSPLVSGSIGRVRNDNDLLIKMSLTSGNIVTNEKLDYMIEWRADQILASKAFEHVITSKKETNKLLKEASILSGKGENRNSREEKRFQDLRKIFLKYFISEYETQVEQEFHQEINKIMHKNIIDLKQQIRERGDDQNR